MALPWFMDNVGVIVKVNVPVWVDVLDMVIVSAAVSVTAGVPVNVPGMV